MKIKKNKEIKGGVRENKNFGQSSMGGGQKHREGDSRLGLTHFGVARWALNQRVVDPEPSLKGLRSAERNIF